MPSAMSVEELRRALSDRERIKDDAFLFAKEISRLCHGADSTTGREMVIRALVHADLFDQFEGVLDALLRRVGLFPYTEPDRLPLRDLLAYEYHRPFSNTDTFDAPVFHREQADVYRLLLEGKSCVLSAPTSFGKSLIVDALLASGKYANIAIIVPTLALIDETRRRMQKFASSFKLVTHPSQTPGPKNIYVLTQERAIERGDISTLDLLVIDEFYKLDTTKEKEGERAATLNHAFYRLAQVSKQIYLLGPHISRIPEAFGSRFRCEFVRTDFNTVVSEIHYLPPTPNREEAFLALARSLSEPTLIYCQSPRQANDVLELVLGCIDYRPESSGSYLNEVADWVAASFHPEWTLCKAMRLGVGLHHGRIPRSLAQLNVRLFNQRELRFLVCTSSLIEGVNTVAKNVVVYESKLATERLDFFTFKNIQGRAGRMFRHFVGNVYVFDQPPEPEFDFVDIPVVTQGADTPLGLLVQLDDADLSPAAQGRVDRLRLQDTLSFETIRLNAHLDPNDQIALARHLSLRAGGLSRALSWRGFPNRDQLRVTCELIYEFFIKRRRAGVSSGSQLAFRLLRLQRASGDIRAFIEEIISKDQNVSSVDEGVELAFQFIRQWATFTFPRYLLALERIEDEIFEKRGLPVGDYASYAQRVENLFLPSEMMGLEEYGLPLQLSSKLRPYLRLGGGLDMALESVQRLDRRTVPLTKVEEDFIDRVVSSS
jgi:hypothetical protein